MHPARSWIPGFLIETRSLPALTRSYPRHFTFYVAYPISSIFPSLARRSCLLRRFILRSLATENGSSCEGWINEGGLLHPSVAGTNQSPHF